MLCMYSHLLMFSIGVTASESSPGKHALHVVAIVITLRSMSSDRDHHRPTFYHGSMSGSSSSMSSRRNSQQDELGESLLCSSGISPAVLHPGLVSPTQGHGPATGGHKDDHIVGAVPL